MDERQYIKALMKEMPEVKAPEGITLKIMQKIAQQPLRTKPMLPWWKRSTFYLFVSMFVVEVAFLIFSDKSKIFETILGFIHQCSAEITRQVVLGNWNVLVGIIAILGTMVYLFVKERTSNSNTAFWIYCRGLCVEQK